MNSPKAVRPHAFEVLTVRLLRLHALAILSFAPQTGNGVLMAL